MKFTIIGSGDAFGSGGRLQTCFHVEAGDGRFLIDCGVTALIGMARQGLDPDNVSTIFVTHLHGDHFGGLIWWVLHARHVTKRSEPLVVVGPRGILKRFRAMAEALYPGSLAADPGFPLEFVEYSETVPVDVGGVTAQVWEVRHPSGAPSYAVKLSVGGKVIGYSGDTEWVDALVDVASDCDLFITECFGLDESVPFHIDWKTLAGKLPLLRARRILLTHMGPSMLAHASKISEPRVLVADDGLVLDI